MLPDAGAAYERYCQAIEDKKEADADAAEHFSIEAHKELRTDFLTAARTSPDTKVRVPCEPARQESIADLILENLETHHLSALLTLARNADPTGTLLWLNEFADKFADTWQEERGVELESAARDDARDDFDIPDRD